MFLSCKKQTAWVRLIKLLLPLFSGNMSLVWRWWFSSKLFWMEHIFSLWFSWWDKHGSFRIFPLLLLKNTVLYYRSSALSMSRIWLVLRTSTGSLVRSTFSVFTTDKGVNFLIKKTFWLNCHLHPLKTWVIPVTTDLCPPLLFLWQMKSTTDSVVVCPWSQFGKKVNTQFRCVEVHLTFTILL